MSSLPPDWADQPPQYTSPKDDAGELRILYFDSMTPRINKRINEIYSNAQPRQSVRSEIEQFAVTWMLSCGSPAVRMEYLRGSYHWLQFLIDDLQLDYNGKPYRVSPWMAQRALQPSQYLHVPVPEELLLDREYVDSKLRERLLSGGEAVLQNTRRSPAVLAENMEKDRKLVESMFKLTEAMSQPYFFKKILTPLARQQIEEGMSKYGKKNGGGMVQGLRSLLGWT